MLTLHEREESRLAIARLSALLDSIEECMTNGSPLDPKVRSFVGQLAQSDVIETQFAAIEDWLKQTTDAYRLKLKLEAPHSLSCFAEYLNPEEPPAFHHEWMIGKLERLAKRELMRLMISMPPGHAKSTYATHLFPAWYIGKNPNHKYIQAGHTQDFVDEEFGKRVRGLIDSEAYREIFPTIKLDPSSKAAARFAIAGHRGKYLGRGVGQGISGFRANCAAVDDPFATAADAESQTVRNGVYNWFKADLTTRLLPRSPLFIVATRWHTDDLCGRLEKANKDEGIIPFEIINLPALADSDDDPLGRSAGEALWPDFYTAEFLSALKATLPAKTWNALYQGHPMDATGSTFQVSWCRRYETHPTNDVDEHGRLVKLNIRRITVSVDTASKAGERNDYTAITVWIEGADRKHYLVDVIRKKLEFNDMVDAIEGAVHKWNARLPGSKVNAILVEDKGSGTQYIQTRRGKAPAPVIAIAVGQNSKEFRFDGVMPVFEAGDVLLPESALWLPDYEAELIGFPFGKFDDQVDSTSQYLDWARIKRRLGTKKLENVTGKVSNVGNSEAGPMDGVQPVYQGRMRGSRSRGMPAGVTAGGRPNVGSAKIGG
jgi:predicted phage terminase large subunit-like protein